MNRLVPTRVDFFHTFDTPSDAAGHTKSTLTGVYVTCLIHKRCRRQVEDCGRVRIQIGIGDVRSTSFLHPISFAKN